MTWLKRWWHRLTCMHYWVEGGLVNFLSGAHEYTCLKCGKKVERVNAPISYIGR